MVLAFGQLTDAQAVCLGKLAATVKYVDLKDKSTFPAFMNLVTRLLNSDHLHLRIDDTSGVDKDRHDAIPYKTHAHHVSHL